MARVTGPMFSLGASGSIKGALTYKCGQFVTKKKPKRKLESSELSDQQLLFQSGSDIWSKGLTEGQRMLWRVKGIFDTLNVMCHHGVAALPLLFVLQPVGTLVALPLGIVTKGYEAWMSFYLTLGSGGWPNYPGPPPSGWVPAKFKGGYPGWN